MTAGRMRQLLIALVIADAGHVLIATGNDLVRVRRRAMLRRHGGRRRTMYVVDQMLHSRRPERVATVIGLEGAYVIPPLAEGHQRDLRFTAQFDSSSAEYMRAGIYYVAVQSYVAALAKELRERAAAAETADAIWAHGAITESSY